MLLRLTTTALKNENGRQVAGTTTVSITETVSTSMATSGSASASGSASGPAAQSGTCRSDSITGALTGLLRFCVLTMTMLLNPLSTGILTGATATSSILAITGLAAMTLVPGGRASAQTRMFPPNALPGVLSSASYPAIVINGKQRDTAANLQIRNLNNLIIVQASLSGDDAIILYVANNQGQIERIWMVSDQELQQYKSLKK